MAAPHPLPLIARPRWRAALILAQYGQQGLVAGFAGTALPNHMAGHGASAVEIGAFLAMVGLPWVAQPLWGPVVDRWPRRRSLLAGQAGALLALALLALLAPATLTGIGLVLLLHGMAASLMDTATDGLIMDAVPGDALGTATACTRIGFAGGGALGAALFSQVLPAFGVAGAGAMLLLACAGLAAAPVALAHATVPQARPGTMRALFVALGRALAEPRTLVLLGYCWAQDFAGALFRVPLGVALVQGGGWSAEALSTLQASLALGAGTIGALLVGWWTDRAGPLRALQILLGAAAAAHLLSAWLGASPAALALSGVTSALSFVALAPAVMMASRGPVAASRFTLYMAALNLGDVSGSALAGPLVGVIGLGGSALVAGLLLAGLGALAAPMLRLGNG
jgi:PAT family beta-lactamase induction signal transducer AmpG